MVQLARVFEIERSREGIRQMGYSDDDILEEMRRFFSRFLDGYAADKGKPRWAEKSCSYVMHVDTIDRVFRAEPVYVTITRNPLDACYSICEVDLENGFGSMQPYLQQAADAPQAAAMFWRDRNATLLDFERTAGRRLLRVRYEDLTADPETVMKRVFAFLDEPWVPVILDYNAFEHDPGYEDPKVAAFAGVSPNSGRASDWPAATRESVLAIAAPMMQRLGYELELS